MQFWSVVGAIGRFMMRTGVVILLFVAYQLWGTGFATARAQGASVANGVAMLAHQAAVQFELWTGVDAPIDVMLASVASQLG